MVSNYIRPTTTHDQVIYAITIPDIYHEIDLLRISLRS